MSGPVRIFAPELFTRKKRYESPERERHLRENAGVDPVLLAADLGLHVEVVKAYQRKLGLRLCAYWHGNTKVQ